MKRIKKACLEELVGLARRYWTETDMDVSRGLCKAMGAYAREVFGPTSRVYDLLTAMLSYGGVKPDATNEDICKVFEVLGWEVKE